MEKKPNRIVKKPFFARYLERQRLESVAGQSGTLKYPSDRDEETMKAPSDQDEVGG